MITQKEKVMVYSSQSSTSISMFGASTPFCLIAPLIPTLFGVFAFYHRQSFYHRRLHPLNQVLIQHLSFHPCMYLKGLRLLLLSRAQETCCTTSNSLYSKLHLGTLLLFAHVVSLQYLIGSYGYSYTISMCPRVISILQISPYSLLIFDSSSSCHNTCPS